MTEKELQESFREFNSHYFGGALGCELVVTDNWVDATGNYYPDSAVTLDGFFSGAVGCSGRGKLGQIVRSQLLGPKRESKKARADAPPQSSRSQTPSRQRELCTSAAINCHAIDSLAP